VEKSINQRKLEVEPMTKSDDLPEGFQRPIEELSYEEALSELEEIVAALESGDQSLNISLALYERGQGLAGYCAGILDQADLKIQQLVGGELVDFELDE
jgi:exodeoxyribonuclease VII small subunit